MLHTAELEPLAERLLMTAMVMNPLVALDRSQLLAAGGRVLLRALLSPALVGRSLAGLGAELWQVAAGTSTRAPDPADRRFADAAFRDSPLYRRLMQGYLAWRDALHRLVDQVDLDAKSRERGRFALTLVTEALAPTNALLGNPAALRRAVETRGASLWSGLRHLAADLVENGGLPAQVDPRPFEVGTTLAASPGSVVFRNEVLELLQYRPATRTVHERPVVFIPPQINKYYVLDLAPGRSLIEFAVRQGFQVFAVSWRNPTPAQRDWDLGIYIEALREAFDAAGAIAASPKVNLVAACAGGITAATFLGHLAARGDDRVAAATFMVTVLDTSVPSMVGTLVSEKTVAAAIRRSGRKGVLAGAELARAFALLRPNDLIWSYWVGNYLLGNDPPAFDVLFWNADNTNLPAALHADFLALFLENSLVKPGALEVADTRIDLGRVAADVYAVGALTDHITPWEACYRTPHLFAGHKTFVASSSGHIQAIVNPPSNPKARYFTGDAAGVEPEEWLAGAREHKGSWWPHWAEWLRERSGTERPAPAEPGSPAHPPGMAAPGRYVRQRAA